MIRIDLPDRLFNSFVKSQQSRMFLVAWFIQRVVSCDPCIVFVVFSEMFPDLDGSILKVFVFPDYESERFERGVEHGKPKRRQPSYYKWSVKKMYDTYKERYEILYRHANPRFGLRDKHEDR